jgi:hypothetical protein
MLHTAFAERLQFGRDVVFTFGAWGFLYGGYHPATYSIPVFVWELFSPFISGDLFMGKSSRCFIASCYERSVRLRSYRLDFERQDLGQTH